MFRPVLSGTEMRVPFREKPERKRRVPFRGNQNGVGGCSAPLFRNGHARMSHPGAGRDGRARRRGRRRGTLGNRDKKEDKPHKKK